MEEKNLKPYKWAWIYEDPKDGKFYILDGGKSRFATANSLEEAKSKIDLESSDCCLNYCEEDSYYRQMTN